MGLPHELKEAEIPDSIDEAVVRINNAIFVTSMSHLIEEDTDDLSKYYQEMMGKIQYLLRGYTAEGHPTNSDNLRINSPEESVLK